MEARIPTRLPWWPLPVFIALGFVFFWPVLGLTAFSDDHSALWGAAVHGTPWRNGFLRPVSDFTFRVVHLLGGTSPLAQRCFNVSLHGANAFLLFAFFIRYLGRSSGMANPVAWLAGLLFIVYPFHQESIVWLVGRESSLGTFFVLLGLLFLNGSGPQWRRIGLACAAMFVGALCYESALLLPLLIIPLAWSGMIADPIAPSKLGVGFGTVFTLYVVVWLMQGNGQDGSYLGGFFEKGPMTFLMNIPKVCARLFLPPMVPSRMAPATVALFVVLTFLMVVIRRSTWHDLVGLRNILVLFLLLIITCTLPVFGSVSTRTSESDRFLYMPSAFLCAIVATLITRIPRTGLRRAATVLLLITSMWLLRQNHRNWEYASATTAQILLKLPAPPTKGRLFVSGLPDSDNGAFIFRNGFRDAISINGRDGGRYLAVPVGRHQHEGFRFGGRDIIPAEMDRWIDWHDGSYHEN